jgi:hypothetical protein
VSYKRQISSLGLYTCYLVGVDHGLGRHVQYVSAADIALVHRTRIGVGVFFVGTSFFLKLSLATTLLKFYEKKGWRFVIYALILFQFGITVVAIFVEFFRCRPLKALWDLSYPRTSCLSEDHYINWLFVLYSTTFLLPWPYGS